MATPAGPGGSTGDAADLAAADPIPRVISWLGSHAAVTRALGAPGRVGADNVPPYPRLRVLDPPGGTDGALRWLLAPEIQIEALGDLDGSPGKAALRFMLYTALGALKELPDAPAEPGQVVITSVAGLRGGGWARLPTGQPRYIASVTCHVHPGR